MKTATLVKPNCVSDCDDIESGIDVFNYSEICSRNNTLASKTEVAYPRFSVANFTNQLYSIKKLTKRKRAIKYKAKRYW